MQFTVVILNVLEYEYFKEIVKAILERWEIRRERSCQMFRVVFQIEIII